MYRLYAALTFLLFVILSLSWSQEAVPLNDPYKAALNRLRNEVNPEYEPWSPDYVIERCAEHLAMVNVEDRFRIRYFDLSTVNRLDHPSLLSALYYTLNSTHIVPSLSTPLPVPNTDNRLFFIDLGWYGHDAQVWENITQEDPYFREPVVRSGDGLNFLRNETQSAGPIVRADWFHYYVMDNTQFLGKNDIKADNAFYYQLVFGLKGGSKDFKAIKVQPKKDTGTGPKAGPADLNIKNKNLGNVVKFQTNVPQTAAEFEAFFRINFNDLKDFPIDVGAMVDTGKSEVSYSNRVLWRVRGNLGVYWRTFDVIKPNNAQDFVENPFPGDFDAGEHIFQDHLGRQFYMLTNGAGGRVEFGDPRAVSGLAANHPAVITPMGCIKCHTNGIRDFVNQHEVLRDNMVRLFAKGFERAIRSDQFFLNPRLHRLVSEDQVHFQEFILDVNGLKAEDNALQIEKARLRYAKAVSLQQGAFELGVTPRELADALGLGVGDLDNPQGTTKGRLGLLITKGEPVPRTFWEQGLYQEAALLVKLRQREQGKKK